MRTRLPAGVAALALATTIVAAPAATAAPTTFAATLTADATSTNLVSYDNPVEDTPYSSPGDGFNIFQRGVSPTIPFAIVDDSASSFPDDDQGIVTEAYLGEFFGITDTVNNDPLPDEVTATWTFEVAASDGPLFANIELGAMGDFESSDTVTISASVDGADPVVASVSIDEASQRTYTLADGDQFTLSDPANIGDAPVVELSNVFAPVSLALPAGDEVAVSISADANGGSEAFAAKQLTITSEAVGTVVAGGGGTGPSTCTTPDDELTLISDVQGDGFTSPVVGDTVTIRGAVTFADADLGGIFVQEEPADVDGDPATSEGLFVFLSGGAADYEVGQTLELSDRVDERFGLTQMAFADIEVCDEPPVEIAPTPLTLPLDDAGREALEGMLVTTTQDLVVSATFSAYRFGEVGLALGDPLVQPTAVFPPGPDAEALAEANAERFLKVDDRGEFGFDNAPWGEDGDLSAGDTVAAGVTGPLTYTFGEYKIEPSGDGFPDVLDTDGRDPLPTVDGGTDVGAFNVLNYFNTFGDSAVLRGARNQEQFELQTDKIVAAINTLDAAVLGLVELENDYEDLYDGDPTTEPSIVTLVDALNADAGHAKWTFVAPDEALLTTEGLGGGGLGTDAIAVGIIYQPDRAEPTGTPATFDIDALLSGDADNNRWPLAQTFDVEGPGPPVTVVVNHFKSKGSPCTDTAGPTFDLGEDVGTDLLGNCNLTREYASQRLLEWLDTRPTGVDHDRNLVVGDLNAYDEERPITLFEDAGYLDLVEALGDDAATFKFDGRYGRLDHALASDDLLKFVHDAEVWRINSPEAYGYLYFNEPVDDSAYASSDHDPVVVGFGPPGRGPRLDR